jgi:hypothetical protein
VERADRRQNMTKVIGSFQVNARVLLKANQVQFVLTVGSGVPCAVGVMILLP